MSDDIKKFWDEQALKYENLSLATTPDNLGFVLELNELLRHLQGQKRVLDLGCGNGKKAEFLNTKLKFKEYIGVDYSQQMMKQALKLKEHLCEIKAELRQVLHFKQGNVLDENLFEKEHFDAVFTSRCLINLTNFKEQKQAIKNIHSFLKKDGLYIMIENMLESLENLNTIRAKFQLEPIKMRWHNCYFSQSKLISFLQKHFIVEEIANFASTYYLVSRTINAVLAQGKEVDYNSQINALASKLPALGDFSPMKCLVLRKK